MTQNEFIRFYSDELGMPMTQARKEIENFMTAFTKATYSDGSVALRGFIKATVEKRDAKEGINPKTKEKIFTPAKTVVKVKALEKFKNMEA